MNSSDYNNYIIPVLNHNYENTNYLLRLIHNLLAYGCEGVFHHKFVKEALYYQNIYEKPLFVNGYRDNFKISEPIHLEYHRRIMKKTLKAVNFTFYDIQNTEKLLYLDIYKKSSGIINIININNLCKPIELLPKTSVPVAIILNKTDEIHNKSLRSLRNDYMNDDRLLRLDNIGNIRIYKEYSVRIKEIIELMDKEYYNILIDNYKNHLFCIASGDSRDLITFFWLMHKLGLVNGAYLSNIRKYIDFLRNTIAGIKK